MPPPDLSVHYCSTSGQAARLSRLKSKKQPSPARRPSAIKAQPEKAELGRAPSSIRKRRPLWQTCLALLALSLLVLTGLEIALRLLGYGHSTSFFRSTGIGGRPVLVENDDF